MRNAEAMGHYEDSIEGKITLDTPTTKLRAIGIS